MNISDSPSQYYVNDNGSINLPFSCAVKTYINSLPLLTNCKLKKQSQLYVNQNIKPSRLFNNKLSNKTEAHNCQEFTSSSKNVNNLTATDQNYDDNAYDNNFKDNAHDNNFKVAINIPHS
ncbi:13169_t:CDS:2, partial [Cetraspora pellucida]